MFHTRLLTNSDQQQIQQLLSGCLQTSMFMVSNMRNGGVEYQGERYQGLWVGAFDADQLIGIVAQFWNGMLMSQCPKSLFPDLIKTLSEHSSIPVAGYTGDALQGEAVLNCLGFKREHFQLYSREVLYTLELAALYLPSQLNDDDVEVRLLHADDQFMVPWRIEYSCEALGAEDTPQLRAQVEERVAAEVNEGQTWVLWKAGQPVSTSNFNASLPECVQIGGVWTPPACRGNGFARAVVSASLLAARARGVSSSILFTDKPNIAARKAYESIGYTEAGEYGLFLLKEPVAWSTLSVALLC